MTQPRVLIVDDDPALLQALREALRIRMEGVTVDTADSARAYYSKCPKGRTVTALGHDNAAAGEPAADPLPVEGPEAAPPAEVPPAEAPPADPPPDDPPPPPPPLCARTWTGLSAIAAVRKMKRGFCI